MDETTGQRIAAAIEHLAAAIEARQGAPISVPTQAQAWTGQTIPTPVPHPAGLCPDHGEPWEEVPAGVSSRTGKAYSAFYACPVYGCRQRPR